MKVKVQKTSTFTIKMSKYTRKIKMTFIVREANQEFIL
jgi:hypothetical protein